MATTLPVTRAEPGENLLMAALPPPVADRLCARLRPVQIQSGQVLTAAGAMHTHVYFPLSCLVSLVVPLAGGRVAEVGIVGREGFVGLPVLLGTDPVGHASICQVAGTALRMPAVPFRSLAGRTPELRLRLYRYAGVRLEESAQLTACNALHAVRQRLARWLLLTQDRVGADRFDLTQEFLAQMLAVRRPYLSRTAQDLQRLGCITYRRGHIAVLDRGLLESTSCDDYDTVRALYARLSST